MNEVLLDSFRHNSLATRDLLRFCQTLTAEQLAARGVGTYGNVVETLDHIVRWCASYAGRMGDRRLDWVDTDDTVIDSAYLERLDARATEVAEVWEAVLASPFDPERVVIVDQGAHATRAGVFLAQAINHANQHREQVCAIITGLGLAPPDIQAWEYAWQTGRIWDLIHEP